MFQTCLWHTLTHPRLSPTSDVGRWQTVNIFCTFLFYPCYDRRKDSLCIACVGCWLSRYCSLVLVWYKSKFHPRTIYCTSAALPRERRLGGPQGRCGRVRKTFPSPGLDPLKVEPVANRCTRLWTCSCYYRCDVHLVWSGRCGHCSFRAVRLGLSVTEGHEAVTIWQGLGIEWSERNKWRCVPNKDFVRIGQW